MKKLTLRMVTAAMLLFAVILPCSLSAQTEIDALMMSKNEFCVGPMYNYSSWKNYWEGAMKRDNENLGTVSTKMIAVMGNYGITRKLSILFSVPYVKTKASAGTLDGMQGIQDLSLYLKWRPVRINLGNGRLSFLGIAGISFPLSDYTPDYLPLSIGLRCKTASGRLMADYKWRSLFITFSGTYLLRDNIEIDRESYYTTEMHNTHEVKMPDATNFNLRIGFRNQRWIAEAVANKWTTLGGFDITRNNMPFPSNKMNATTVGGNFKYVLPPMPQLSIVAGGNTTVAGSNMGQATTIYGAAFYILDFSRRSKSSHPTLNVD